MEPASLSGEERVVKNYETLFRLAKSLHLYPDIDALLGFITAEIVTLIQVEGAMVLLLDPDTQEFFFSAATYSDGITGQRIKSIRFPSDKGIAGQVFKTGMPMIVADTSKSDLFFEDVDKQTGHRTKNMLDVPIRVHTAIIGVLCTVNKKEGGFDHRDIELLSAIADTVAHPIENARINQELTRSYEEVKSLNSVKDKVIHHLSHELKTPLSVLTASLDLLERKKDRLSSGDVERIFARARRSLQRLLEMQYEIEDLLKKKEYRVFHLLSRLLDACKDQLEVLVTEEMGGREVIRRIERRIEELFGPRQSVSGTVRLDRFVETALRRIGFRFAHRDCRIIKQIEKVPPILIPEAVLIKILEGLIKNGIENTPDKGEIRVGVRPENGSVLLEIEDYGMGITPENMKLLFENYFTAYDTNSYASGRPYEFGAGGKGFDLLRMKIFSEQYHFRIKIRSNRCPHIVEGSYPCPGNMEKCINYTQSGDCRESGGTMVSIHFPRLKRTERGSEVKKSEILE